MDNKEEIYDEEIFPLIKKIIDICKKHKMPIFTSFQYSNDGFVLLVVGEVGMLYSIITKLLGKVLRKRE